MTRYKVHRYSTVAIAFVLFITLFIITACGQATPNSNSNNKAAAAGEVIDNIKVYIVRGKPLECIIVNEGFHGAQDRTMGMSCDWVKYHEDDKTEAVQ